MRAVSFGRTEQGISARKLSTLQPQLLPVRPVANEVQKAVPIKPHLRLSFYAIAERICRVFGYRLADIRSHSRAEKLVLARQAICYWVRRLIGYSLQRIGRLIGRSDHTTVRHAILIYPKKRAKAGRCLPSQIMGGKRCE